MWSLFKMTFSPRWLGSRGTPESLNEGEEAINEVATSRKRLDEQNERLQQVERLIARALQENSTDALHEVVPLLRGGLNVNGGGVVAALEGETTERSHKEQDGAAADMAPPPNSHGGEQDGADMATEEAGPREVGNAVDVDEEATEPDEEAAGEGGGTGDVVCLADNGASCVV
eukprot:GHVS01093879.1.p1 GENE.GHVS01093879.1~~GHVS01093879.1.p1  ORF type:complete len:173 (+),score=52.84 GHVS01093879.1:564-1082(+)